MFPRMGYKGRGFYGHGMGDNIGPNGYFQFIDSIEPGEHLGKRISFYDLPEENQQALLKEIGENGKFKSEAGQDDQVEPVTSGMSNGNFGGNGATGTGGAPDLAVQSSDEIAITAGPLRGCAGTVFLRCKGPVVATHARNAYGWRRSGRSR